MPSKINTEDDETSKQVMGSFKSRRGSYKQALEDITQKIENKYLN